MSVIQASALESYITFYSRVNHFGISPGCDAFLFYLAHWSLVFSLSPQPRRLSALTKKLVLEEPAAL